MNLNKHYNHKLNLFLVLVVFSLSSCGYTYKNKYEENGKLFQGNRNENGRKVGVWKIYSSQDSLLISREEYYSYFDVTLLLEKVNIDAQGNEKLIMSVSVPERLIIYSSKALIILVFVLLAVRFGAMYFIVRSRSRNESHAKSKRKIDWNFFSFHRYKKEVDNKFAIYISNSSFLLILIIWLVLVLVHLVGSAVLV